MPPIAVWINGLVVGFTIVMMASGLVLVLSIMGILNWTHGQLNMAAAFIVYYVSVKLGMNYFLALFVATAAVAGIGVVIERWLLRLISGKGFLGASVVTLGLIFVFEGVVTVCFGTGFKAVPSVLKGMIHAGPVSISLERLALVGIAVATMLGLYFFINRTKIGLAIRATAQEPVVAGLYGVHAGRLFTIVMATGSGLAALAGGLVAPVYFVDPFIGSKPLILALLAIILGGLGSFRGAVFGGILLGFMATVVVYYIGAWYELVSFSIIIAIILFRPHRFPNICQALYY